MNHLSIGEIETALRTLKGVIPPCTVTTSAELNDRIDLAWRGGRYSVITDLENVRKRKTES